MTPTIEPRSCPTCWSTRCLAGKDSPYAHRWEDGPMAAAHARWKDERTPPASLQEAIERGFIKPENAPPESVTDTESVTRESVTDQPEPESVTASERACIECGKPLASTRPDARFCSPSCRMKAHRRAAESPAA